jgi:hypothetical protein
VWWDESTVTLTVVFISLQVISLHCGVNVKCTTMWTSVTKTNVPEDYVTADCARYTHFVYSAISLQVISPHCGVNATCTTMWTNVAKTNVSAD